MNEQPTPPPEAAQEMDQQAWFDNAATPQPEPPKKPIWLILCVSIVTLTVAGLVAALFMITRSTPAVSCFSASNYDDLLTTVNVYSDSEVQQKDIAPQQLLFAETLYFTAGTTSFDIERTDSNPAELIQSLGAYQQQHTLTAPIVVQVETSYAAVSDLALTKQRLAQVKDLLVKAGFDESAIISKEPTLLQLTDESAIDDDVIDGIPVTISIAPSAAACTEGSL